MCDERTGCGSGRRKRKAKGTMAHLARDDEAEVLNQAINGLRAGAAAKEKREMSSELYYVCRRREKRRVEGQKGRRHAMSCCCVWCI